jgi:hypothetical protein
MTFERNRNVTIIGEFLISRPVKDTFDWLQQVWFWSREHSLNDGT